eukprot:Skav214904  [mRNA]  locus=scaffold1561:155121:161159:- [translate_table: standard]
MSAHCRSLGTRGRSSEPCSFMVQASARTRQLSVLSCDCLRWCRFDCADVLLLAVLAQTEMKVFETFRDMLRDAAVTRLSGLNRCPKLERETAASHEPVQGAALDSNIEAAKPQGGEGRVAARGGFQNGKELVGTAGIQNLNVFLAHPLSPLKFGGVFHAGVEIGGEEWSFGYAPSGSGLHCSVPREHPQHNFRETLELGETTLTKAEVASLLEKMLDEYPGSSYHLIRCNCNHFASDLCRRLGVGDLPAWVERLAWIGESLLEASEGFERLRCASRHQCVGQVLMSSGSRWIKENEVCTAMPSPL